MSPTELPPATTARDRSLARLLIFDPTTGATFNGPSSDLPLWLSPGDLLVVNDAATLPASLFGRTSDGAEVELRLAARGTVGFWAILFGAGDWHQRTEDRPLAPPLLPGAVIELGGLFATVARVDPESPRLVEVVFDLRGDALWAAIYRLGRPVQYAYHRSALPLWSVQTAYAARPVAFEMPSAGRPLGGEVLLGLRRRGVEIATLTHAAGLSSTGDPILDRRLPLPERYEIPEATMEMVAAARARGGRVIAVGTTVVRALESAASSDAKAGITELKIGPGYRLRSVTDLLTGMHLPSESHYDLANAFAPADRLAVATELASALGYLSHEFGDLMLILRGAARARAA